MKIGDIDPRDDARACIQVSEKSLAIAGGVLEAILAKAVARRQ
jgi:xanthine dehydrogenase accessory factor